LANRLKTIFALKSTSCSMAQNLEQHGMKEERIFFHLLSEKKWSLTGVFNREVWRRKKEEKIGVSREGSRERESERERYRERERETDRQMKKERESETESKG
jgi:hypothetical protein